MNKPEEADLGRSFERLLIESNDDIEETTKNNSIYNDPLVLSADKECFGK